MIEKMLAAEKNQPLNMTFLKVHHQGHKVHCFVSPYSQEMNSLETRAILIEITMLY